MLVTPPIAFQGKCYVFRKYVGLLLCYDVNPSESKRAFQHTEDFNYVANPYLLRHRQLSTDVLEPSWQLKLYARVLIGMCKHLYPAIFLIPHIIKPICEDAGVANAVFYRMFPEEQQRKLCLPRALFCASLSKRFRRNGTLFIGTFLPTSHLHAWVIEDGMHADVYDQQWIQYQPVMEWQWGRKS